jgi:hypothetical protein
MKTVPTVRLADTTDAAGLPSQAAVRHGQGRGSVTLGGRRVAVDRPRARTLDGYEVPLANC